MQVYMILIVGVSLKYLYKHIFTCWSWHPSVTRNSSSINSDFRKQTYT